MWKRNVSIRLVKHEESCTPLDNYQAKIGQRHSRRSEIKRGSFWTKEIFHSRKETLSPSMSAFVFLEQEASIFTSLLCCPTIFCVFFAPVSFQCRGKEGNHQIKIPLPSFHRMEFLLYSLVNSNSCLAM